MEDKKLLRLQARRRGHLKKALEKYASVFDMRDWFQQKRKLFDSVEPILQTPHVGSPIRRAMAYLTSTSKKFKLHGIRPVKEKINLKKFEECGTACCIAGLDFARSGRSIGEQREFYGIKSDDLYTVGTWPDDISAAYYTARENKDHKGMVEAAKKAIDYFSKHVAA